MIINDSTSLFLQNCRQTVPLSPLLEKIPELPGDRVTITGRRKMRRLSYSSVEAARTLFKTSESPSFRKTYDDHAVVSGGPFLNRDGTVYVVDFRSIFGYDAESLQSKALHKFSPQSEGPDFHRTVFTAGGTCLFTSGDKRIRAFREGRELFSIPIDGELNSPVAATDSVFAYATGDGMVHVHNADGSRRDTFAVPLEGDEKKDWDRKPRQIFIGARDRIYGITGNNHLIYFKNGAIAWNVEMGEILPPSQFEVNPLESSDGKTIYGSGKSGVIALDSESRQLRWAADLGSGPAATPIADEHGNIYVLTRNGKISVLSPEGKKLRDWDTGEHIDVVNSAVPKLRFDGRGNILVPPNPCRFQIYTREGEPIIKMKCKDLFREVDYIQDFSLTADGKKAIILAGSYSIGELELPCTPAQRAAEEKDRVEETDSAGILEDDGYIIIDGIRVNVRQ